jgi:hypothetical protein
MAMGNRMIQHETSPEEHFTPEEVEKYRMLRHYFNRLNKQHFRGKTRLEDIPFFNSFIVETIPLYRNKPLGHQVLNSRVSRILSNFGLPRLLPQPLKKHI